MSRRLVSVDSETHLIQPGLLTPPIVCGSMAWFEQTSEGLTARGKLLYPGEYLDQLERFLAMPDVILTGANIPFDFGCAVVARPRLLRPIFKAYAEWRVYDILVAEALNAIHEGHLFKERNGFPLMSARKTQTDRYSLDICVRLNLGRTDAKVNDFWKLRYALLENLRHEDWPEEARVYPVDDAANQLLVTAHQLGWQLPERYYGSSRSPVPYKNLSDLPAQVETDWALHLGALWGIRTDGERVDILAARAEELHREYVAKFTETGFFRKTRPEYLPGGKRYGKVDSEAGTKDTFAVAQAIAVAYGASGVCTDCGGIGRKQRVKQEPCRGYRPTGKGKYPGCPGAGCLACAGTRQVNVAADPVFCVKCAGTGFADISMVPLTDGGTTGVQRVKSDRDTLAECGTEHLMEFGENKHEKALKTYVPFLKKGIERPITLEPNVLVESGRASYAGVIMLFPRGGQGLTTEELWVPTPRECIVARPGRVFISVDFGAGELCSLSSVCKATAGFSEMGAYINKTKKPGSLHSMFGARMVGEEPEAFQAKVDAKDKKYKGIRQAAKPLMFGLPGGMGVPKLVLTNRKEAAGETIGPDGRKYPGIRFCILAGGMPSCGLRKRTRWGTEQDKWAYDIAPTCADCLELVHEELKPLWFKTFPEVREYHSWVKRTIRDRDGLVPCFGPNFAKSSTHRYRKVEEFAAAANAGFQSLIADITKTALRKVTREAYLDEASPLYRATTRVVGFFHDELFCSCDEALAHEVGQRVSELMMEAYYEWIPDVYGTAEPAAMRYWSKDAEAVYEVSFDHVADTVVSDFLVAAGWKPEKAGEVGRARRGVFGDLGLASKFAAAIRAVGGTATEPRLTVWEPKK